MSNEFTQPETIRRDKPSRVGGFVSARRGGMFGIAEIIALTVSCFVFLLVLLSYLYFLLPSRSRVATLTADRAQLQSNIKKSQEIVSRDENTENAVHRITDSLTKFETIGLLTPDAGRMELYDQLNQLMVKNGLRNTSGPTYTPLDPVGTKQTPGKSTSTKWQTAYPGIAVAVTVEGQYQNVRHFIKDIEQSKQFIIINEVELQRATQNDAPATPADAAAGSGTRGSLVSLQLNMATYFRRVVSSPESGQPQ